MDFEDIRAYCLSFDQATEETPFGPEALVYKVKNKMFALLTFHENTVSLNLKNDPDLNVELREKHAYIIPGYHMNKKHWNTVRVVPQLKEQFLKDLIAQSYAAVLAKPKKK